MGSSNSSHPECSPDRRDEIADLLHRCEARLMARIRWMMGLRARQLAETADFHTDLVHKILIEAERLQWRDEAHFLRLATRIARQLLIDQVRRPRVQRFDSLSTVQLCAGGDNPGPASVLAAEERREHLFRCLESLSAEHEQVLALRYFEELSFRQIGEIMGRSENAVEVLHRRACKRLGEALGS